jgi:phospholipid/cholesterol/gamma-HCH transport system permease protein
VSGRWVLDTRPPSAAEVFEHAHGEGDTRVALDAERRLEWDSGLLIFLRGVIVEAQRRRMSVDLGGLPDGAQRLLALANATPEHPGVARDDDRPPVLGRIGARAIVAARSAVDALAFVGGAGVGMFRLLIRAARFRGASEFLGLVQDVGAQALPIVSLITFLVGVILAYVGAVQLRAFGAQAYVADLVSVAMTREMGAMMTAVVMAGRTGAAFAAQLGTMQVNEEIDALTTFGISPMEFLVVPRMVALAVMMPLLYLYADLLGMLGGRGPRWSAPPWRLRVLRAQYAGDRAERLRGRAHQGVGVRRAGGDRRLPPRHAVRTQLRRRGRGRDVGRRHGDRADHRRGRGDDGPLRRPPSVKRNGWRPIDVSAEMPPHIAVRDLEMVYGDRVIQRHLNFTVERGDIFVIMGRVGRARARCSDT